MKSFRAVALVLFTLAALVAAAPAMADTASVTFLDASGSNDPVVGIGRAFTLSGNSTAPKRIYIRSRPAGGAPCAPSASSDSGNTYFSGYGYPFNGTSVNGDFTLRSTGVWGTPGTFMFCIWLATSDDAVATPIRQDITFRNPTGTISGSVTPAAHRLTRRRQ